MLTFGVSVLVLARTTFLVHTYTWKVLDQGRCNVVAILLNPGQLELDRARGVLVLDTSRPKTSIWVRPAGIFDSQHLSLWYLILDSLLHGELGSRCSQSQ